MPWSNYIFVMIWSEFVMILSHICLTVRLSDCFGRNQKSIWAYQTQRKSIKHSCEHYWPCEWRRGKGVVKLEWLTDDIFVKWKAYACVSSRLRKRLKYADNKIKEARLAIRCLHHNKFTFIKCSMLPTWARSTAAHTWTHSKMSFTVTKSHRNEFPFSSIFVCRLRKKRRKNDINTETHPISINCIHN